MGAGPWSASGLPAAAVASYQRDCYRAGAGLDWSWIPGVQAHELSGSLRSLSLTRRSSGDLAKRGKYASEPPSWFSLTDRLDLVQPLPLALADLGLFSVLYQQWHSQPFAGGRSSACFDRRGGSVVSLC